MGEEIGYKAQPEQAHGHQDHAGHYRQGERGGHIAHRPFIGDAPHSDRRHQRDDSYRPDGQRAPGAEDCIEHQRRHGGVEPGFGRHARQHGIGQRLRNQHDRDDQRRHQITDQRLATVFTAPLKDGQIAGKRH